MKKNLFFNGFMAATMLLVLGSCSMMTEDRSDCPTGLYVNFVYDYNIDRSDMFKDHVGGVRLYVYDESDNLVLVRETSGSPLLTYGYNIHINENELPSVNGARYRLKAVAMQKDIAETQNTPGAKYRISPLDRGSQRNALNIVLDHDAEGNVSASAPLDTLWHTLITMNAVSENQPTRTSYHLNSDDTSSNNGVEYFTVKSGVPTYATVSLIRDTKHLHVSLRKLDNTTGILVVGKINHEDYEVKITGANSYLNYENNICFNPQTGVKEELTYRPYAQWTSVLDEDGNQSYAHYDIMFNRILFKSSAESDGSVLHIINRRTGNVVASMPLAPALAEGRKAYEIHSYIPQEYLDREHDYHLDFYMLNGEWYGSVCIDVLSWSIRLQNVSF